MSRATFETLWHTHPERFDRKRTSLDRHLFNQLAAALPQNLATLSVADLGCGKGEISLLCQSRGATIDAVDIADNALKHLEYQPAITPLRQALPHTTLRDQHYDIVCCIDLIATLPQKDHRLLLSEIARIAKPDATLFLSTPLDIHSSDALDRFLALAETELIPLNITLSTQTVSIKLLDCLKAPSRFLQGATQPHLRDKYLAQRSGLSHKWFAFNIRHSALWKPIHKLSTPLLNTCEQSDTLHTLLQHLSNTPSHILLTAQKRPLSM